MTRGHGLIMRGAAAARLNMMLHGLGPYVPERARFASAPDAFVLPGEIQAAGPGETRVAPRLVRRPYSAACTSGVPRARRSAFKSSATRKATSIACSALSRGSQ